MLNFFHHQDSKTLRNVVATEVTEDTEETRLSGNQWSRVVWSRGAGGEQDVFATKNRPTAAFGIAAEFVGLAPKA